MIQTLCFCLNGVTWSSVYVGLWRTESVCFLVSQSVCVCARALGFFFFSSYAPLPHSSQAQGHITLMSTFEL